MVPFLHNFACFDCLVSFKRPATHDPSRGSSHLAESELLHNCPNCGHRMAFMGRNFATPPKSDKSGWVAAKGLWEAGFRYSGSGYHNDAPLPRSKQEVNGFVDSNPKHVQRIGAKNKWSEYV